MVSQHMMTKVKFFLAAVVKFAARPLRGVRFIAPSFRASLLHALLVCFEGGLRERFVYTPKISYIISDTCYVVIGLMV